MNGELRDAPDGATVADLLRSLGSPGEGIAVEVNEVIVRRRDHGARALGEGDRVEIVGLVGGG